MKYCAFTQIPKFHNMTFSICPHLRITLTQNYRTSLRRNLSYICGCRLYPVGFPGHLGVGEREAEVAGLLSFWDEGRISLCRPERRFPNESPMLSSLTESCVLIMRPTGRAPLVPHLCCNVSIRASVQSEGFGGKREADCHRDPFNFSSVHHWSQILPLSSGSGVRLGSSHLLLLPLFSLCCSLSSNSITIQKLWCDKNAASSAIKTISPGERFCHLNCMSRAHVTPNSPCVAVFYFIKFLFIYLFFKSVDNMNSC